MQKKTVIITATYETDFEQPMTASIDPGTVVDFNSNTYSRYNIHSDTEFKVLVQPGKKKLAGRRSRLTNLDGWA